MAYGGESKFDVTPSWIGGLVVFFIVGISLIVEKLLHHIGMTLKHQEKKALYEGLLKIKEELMLMGFISLLLAVTQDQVGKLCIPQRLAHFWLPCGQVPGKKRPHREQHFQITPFGGLSNRGRLADASPSCPEGKVPFLSVHVLHDLHYLIFILAVVHVITCTVIVLLGEVQIRQWRKWEEDIRKNAHNAEDSGNKVIEIRNLAFIKDRFEGIDANKRNYVFAFFKHLCGIVTREDYEAMRFGFVMAHCKANQKFNFHRYIGYAYEGAFEEVVSISWFLWLLVVLSLSLNVAGWHIYTWLLTAVAINCGLNSVTACWHQTSTCDHRIRYQRGSKAYGHFRRF